VKPGIDRGFGVEPRMFIGGGEFIGQNLGTLIGRDRIANGTIARCYRNVTIGGLRDRHECVTNAIYLRSRTNPNAIVFHQANLFAYTMKTPAPRKTQISLSTLSLRVEQADRKASEAKDRARSAKIKVKQSRKALKHARKEAKRTRRLAKEAQRDWAQASGNVLSAARVKGAQKKTGAQESAPAKKKTPASGGNKARKPKSIRRTVGAAKKPVTIPPPSVSEGLPPVMTTVESSLVRTEN